MRQRFSVHHLESPAGRNLIALNGVTKADIVTALAKFQEQEKVHIGTVIGVNEGGLFASERDNWNPMLPDAYVDPFLVLPWVQIFELLGRVTDGSFGVLLSNHSQTKQ